MERFSCVVLLQTLFKVGRHSQIALALRRNTLDKIDVIQKLPSFDKASEGIPLRAMKRQSCEARRREAGWMESVRSQIEQILPPVRVPR